MAGKRESEIPEYGQVFHDAAVNALSWQTSRRGLFRKAAEVGTGIVGGVIFVGCKSTPDRRLTDEEIDRIKKQAYTHEVVAAYLGSTFIKKDLADKYGVKFNPTDVSSNINYYKHQSNPVPEHPFANMVSHGKVGEKVDLFFETRFNSGDNPAVQMYASFKTNEGVIDEVQRLLRVPKREEDLDILPTENFLPLVDTVLQVPPLEWGELEINPKNSFWYRKGRGITERQDPIVVTVDSYAQVRLEIPQLNRNLR